MAKIKNINGTSDNNCTCGSWLKHWETFSEKTVIFCSEKSCMNNNLVGAHVQKTTSDMKWYIVPLCQTHNMSSGELEISDSITFVSANKSETCNN